MKTKYLDKVAIVMEMGIFLHVPFRLIRNALDFTYKKIIFFDQLMVTLHVF